MQGGGPTPKKGPTYKRNTSKQYNIGFQTTTRLHSTTGCCFAKVRSKEIFEEVYKSNCASAIATAGGETFGEVKQCYVKVKSLK